MESYTCEEITQAPKIDYRNLHRLLKSSYGITQARVTDLTGYEDCNLLLSDVVWKNGGPSHAILKVTNPIEARSDENIDFQIRLCDVLNMNGIPCPKTIKRLDGRDWAWEVIADKVQLPVRLFEVLPGTNLENFNFEPELVQEIGRLLAKFHNVVDKSKLSITHVPYIAVAHRQSILKEMELQLEASLISADKAQLIRDCLAEFNDRIGNNCEHNEIGLIHSDFNETNILVCEEHGKMKITGLLDFGDVHHSSVSLTSHQRYCIFTFPTNYPKVSSF
ncbi:aminoglycoside phosphotransferase domain containing 1 [Parelaphostrongylus tenuis]|uniref:Hydroxylysine kinase n=1 Tax=Parelaphostrongylus tenuis TaxID=148309 RepID=A0AAD5WIE0_PARTN|nr:aminoglycoside phosphotransferase domain containing 1 [Parelaphostrongylus tenuis]